jgi:NAD(P)H-dependent FMN reductase
VLAICGSLQRRSANRAALDVVTLALTGQGSVVERFDHLAGIPAFDVDQVDAPIASVVDWRQRIDAAEALVIAAPEYAGGVAGTVKNALDWLVGSGNLYRKPVVIMSAGTTGGRHARQQLAQTLTWQGAYVIAEVGIAHPRAKSDRDGRLVDATTLVALSSVAAVVSSVPTMRADDLVSAATRVARELGVDTAHIAPAA